MAADLLSELVNKDHTENLYQQAEKRVIGCIFPVGRKAKCAKDCR